MRATKQQTTKRTNLSTADVWLVAGVTLFTTGLWLIWLPLGVLFLGVVFMVGGVLAVAQERRARGGS